MLCDPASSSLSAQQQSVCADVECCIFVQPIQCIQRAWKSTAASNRHLPSSDSKLSPSTDVLPKRSVLPDCGCHTEACKQHESEVLLLLLAADSGERYQHAGDFKFRRALPTCKYKEHAYAFNVWVCTWCRHFVKISIGDASPMLIFTRRKHFLYITRCKVSVATAARLVLDCSDATINRSQIAKSRLGCTQGHIIRL